MKKEYQYEYEYKEPNGRRFRCVRCTVYFDYQKCENALCDELTDLEFRGYEDVQGRVIELGAK